MNIGNKIIVSGIIVPEYEDHKRTLHEQPLEKPIEAFYIGTTHRCEGILKKEHDWEEGSLYNSVTWIEFKQTKRIKVIQWRKTESSKIQESLESQIVIMNEAEKNIRIKELEEELALQKKCIFEMGMEEEEYEVKIRGLEEDLKSQEEEQKRLKNTLQTVRELYEMQLQRTVDREVQLSKMVDRIREGINWENDTVSCEFLALALHEFNLPFMIKKQETNK